MLELPHLLSDPVLILSFADFLLKEKASEPLEFWMRTELYRQIQDPKKIVKTACKIYKRYLKPGAEQEVNLDARMKVLVGMKLKSKQVSPQLFSSLQKDAHTLLAFEFLPRFCNSFADLSDMLARFQPKTSFKFTPTLGRTLKKYTATLKTSSSHRRSMQLDGKRGSTSYRNSVSSSSASLSVKRQSKEMMKRRDVSSIASRFSRSVSIAL